MENMLDYIDGLDELKLTPPTDRFPDHEMLKRSQMKGLDATLWDELCIATSEGDIETHPAFSKEFDLAVKEIGRLRLKADTSIRFDGKQSLKHRPSLRPAIWLGAIAAVVAVIMVIPMLISDKGEINDTVVAVNKVSTTPDKQQVPDIPAGYGTQAGSDAVTKDNAQKPAVRKTVISTDATKTIMKMENSPIVRSDILTLASEPKIDIKPDLQISYHVISLFVSTEATDKKNLESVFGNIVSFASRVLDDPKFNPNNIKPIEQLSEKGILAINRLLDRETVVIKEYDENGDIVLHSVKSKVLNFSRSY